MIGQSCPGCSSDNISDCGKPYLADNNTKYSVSMCNICQLQWCTPKPTNKEISEYYSTYYERRFTRVFKTSLKGFKEFVTFKYIREYAFLKTARKFIKVENFLDYGCGEGELLIIGKKLGWKSIGTEYSAELKEKFEKMGIELIVANDFKSSNLPINHFQLISMKHVIEHLSDLTDILNQIKAHLVKNGILAIKTPSNTCFRARTSTAKWHYVNPPEHLWSFNPTSLGILLNNNGYEVLKIRNSILVDELICYAKVK
jgi:SAM-dependent methyltransferase